MTGDDGATPVFEAILVAILISTAFVYLTKVQTPSEDRSVGGDGLDRVAEAALTILAQRPPDDPDIGDDRLQEIVRSALAGGDQETAAGYIDEVLPSGVRFSLRLHNGLGALRLVPPASVAPSPSSGAVASSMYQIANWTSSGNGPAVAPGDAFDRAGWTDLASPLGPADGPGGAWLALWDVEDPGRTGVPAWAPYGWWTYWDAGACSGGCDVEVVRPDGEAAQRPLYAVQLVVWEAI